MSPFQIPTPPIVNAVYWTEIIKEHSGNVNLFSVEIYGTHSVGNRWKLPLHSIIGISDALLF